MTAKLVAAGIGFMNNKAHGLTLFDVVKSDNMAVPLTVSRVERFCGVGCMVIANLMVTDGVINPVV